MGEPGKRKCPPATRGAQYIKRSKGGNGGRWKTPQAQLKALNVQRGTVEPGDAGIWVTCARGMEGKAARDLQLLLDEYAGKIYGIHQDEETWAATKSGDVNCADDGNRDTDENVDDIEAITQKELSSLKSVSAQHDRIFAPIKLNVECLLFTKTRPPIDPVALVYRICKDAKGNADAAADAAVDAEAREPASQAVRSCRYLNRLTPISASGRATEKGIQEVAHQVLSPWFSMLRSDVTRDSAPTSSAPVADNDYDDRSAKEDEKPAHTFAIRLSMRHHNHLKREDIIKLIAALVDGSHHKVNLDKPDKVVLVDIFKFTCGMSVVDGDWADFKKFNLSEIYNLQLSGKLTRMSGNSEKKLKPCQAEAAKRSEQPSATR